MKNMNDELNIDENEIASMIYERINAYWGKFPNIWNYVTKDDMASQVVMDLYRPRKADGVPHIIHYYKNKGARSLKPLIGMIAYRVLQAEARDIHSTGVFNNDARRNLYNAISLELPIGGYIDGGITLGDTVSDSSVDVSKEVDYVMLFDSLPNKTIDGVFYKVEDKYIMVSYKTILRDILDGYNLSQISDKMYKKNKSGDYSRYRELSSIVSQMKEDMKEFLASEYNFTDNDYNMGGYIL